MFAPRKQLAGSCPTGPVSGGSLKLQQQEDRIVHLRVAVWRELHFSQGGDDLPDGALDSRLFRFHGHPDRFGFLPLDFVRAENVSPLPADALIEWREEIAVRGNGKHMQHPAYIGDECLLPRSARGSRPAPAGGGGVGVGGVGHRFDSSLRMMST